MSPKEISQAGTFLYPSTVSILKHSLRTGPGDKELPSPGVWDRMEAEICSPIQAVFSMHWNDIYDVFVCTMQCFSNCLPTQAARNPVALRCSAIFLGNPHFTSCWQCYTQSSQCCATWADVNPAKGRKNLEIGKSGARKSGKKPWKHLMAEQDPVSLELPDTQNLI